MLHPIMEPIVEPAAAAIESPKRFRPVIPAVSKTSSEGTGTKLDSKNMPSAIPAYPADLISARIESPMEDMSKVERPRIRYGVRL